jgi:lactate permease
MVMGGRKALKTIWPAALVCGTACALTQFVASSSPYWQLTDILSSIVAMLAMVVVCRIRKDSVAAQPGAKRYSAGQVILAWSPYVFLVLFVALLNLASVKAFLNHTTVVFGWPGLDRLVVRVPPVVPKAAPYAASYTFNPLTATGTAALFAFFASALVLRVAPGKLLLWTWATMKQLALPTLTIASVLALAFLMNYSGATATLGLSFASTGAIFPFFSALLGWIGVFLTGSDTSANALFGSLQVVTANKLALNPALIAAANSSGGVMGKMISIQSIAVAAAATGMSQHEEGKLMRFTLKHSILLASANGLLAMFYAYVAPGWVR